MEQIIQAETPAEFELAQDDNDNLYANQTPIIL